MPKYYSKNDLSPTKYTVSADAVADYTASFSGMTVTYTYTPGKTQAAVTIYWDDMENLDGIRPESVDVTIKSEDGSDTRTITLNQANGWRGTIENLDAALNYNKADVVRTEIITGEDTETTYAVEGTIGANVRRA